MTAYASNGLAPTLKGRHQGKKAIRRMMNGLQGGFELRPLRITPRPRLIAGLLNFVPLKTLGYVTLQTKRVDVGS